MILRYDAYIPGIETLQGAVDASAFDPDLLKKTNRDSQNRRKELSQADALFIRTVTKITPSEFPELALPENRVRFIATASAGKDHVDETWLESLGIHFAYAPGCNASAVAEYVVSAILIWLSDQNNAQRRPHVGLLGAGYTGSATAALLKKLGFPVVLYDPPRERLDPDFTSCRLEKFQEAAIWSLHVPLTHSGQDATFHLVDESMFSQSTPELLIQASRGGVVDETILWNQDLPDWVCDVWENEPNPNRKSLSRTKFATPHIAGYSVEAKTRALHQIVDAFVSFSGIDLQLPAKSNPSSATNSDPSSSARILDSNLPATLGEAITRLHPILRYHQELKRVWDSVDENLTAPFLRIRNEFPLRHEFSALKCPRNWHDHYPELRLLGVGQE